MPGATVVDEGYSSRDGYELMVSGFGPGAAAPLYIPVDRGEAERVVAIAQLNQSTANASIVTPPSENDRVVVRVIPQGGVDDEATMDLVASLAHQISLQPLHRPSLAVQQRRTTTSRMC